MEIIRRDSRRIPWQRFLFLLLLFIPLFLVGCQPSFSTGSPIGLTSNDQILYFEEIIIGLLFLAILMGIIANRLRMPYTIGLVLIGLLLSLSVTIEINVPPNLILAFLVPPLVFEAAFQLNLNDLRRNLPFIISLSIPGVIFTTALTGVIIFWGTGLALPVALVFGALVSATDPVSVVALFRSIGAPKRLSVIIEAESLFNDGTAIVIFELVSLLAIAGMSEFRLAPTLLEFIVVTGGGLIVGALLGMLASQVINRIDDYLIETTLTGILAYSSYLIADILGVSGVLAVVAAGLVNGNIGPKGMSPTTRIVVNNFWEVAAFLANSFIFLLIGLQIHLELLFENWLLILWAITATLISRAAIVYLVGAFTPNIPRKWKHVIFWGGLRGAICLALALSLPAGLGKSSQQVQVMALGVVLFTLLVQGFSIKPLIKKLGIVERSDIQDEYERRNARSVVGRTAYNHLEKSYRQGRISQHTWNILSPLLNAHNESLTKAVRDVMISAPELEAIDLEVARSEFLRAQRTALTDLLQDGVISDNSFEYLTKEIDAALDYPNTSWPDLFGQVGALKAPINRLVLAVIQEQDVENSINSLTKLGMSVTCLSSKGGFMSGSNMTLLIGLMHGQEEIMAKTLNKSCRRRVVYLNTPLPEMGMLSPSIPVTVGGATIFTFEVERFEVI
ncbi:MAG: Na+/H+ antiporter [Anaerolineales bacterium]|nr:Na+/H+ antiporter [Anaerolineales bacterium]